MENVSRMQLQEAAQVLREQQRRYQEVLDSVRLKEAREAAVLAPAIREARKEWGKHIASTFGLPRDAKMGRKILVEGRRAFDPEYNSLDHGARLSAGETLSVRG